MSADSAAPSPSSRVLRALRVERNEAKLAFLLALFLLCGMAAVICLKAVSDAVFLSEFDATRLPYVDLTITILIGVLVNYYLRWSSRVTLATLVSRTQAGLAASVLLFWLLLGVRAGWAPILLYLWVGLFAILIPSQVWSLAAATFTTRQAKRLFALIGSGGILGAALGGNFTGFISPRIGAPSLLPFAAVLLMVCAWIARSVAVHKPRRVAETAASEAKAPLLESVRLLGRHRYLLLIALAVIASTVAGTLVKYEFKAIAQAYFEADRDSIASFQGYFTGSIAVVSFLFHATLSTRLLRWAGLGLTLFVLPVAMLSGITALLVSASIGSAVWARAADQGFRHSIDRASSELLWVPVPEALRNRVKSFMDVVVGRSADGLASLILLALLYAANATVQHISWVGLAFVVAWLGVLWTLRGEYLRTLRTTIERPDISAEQLLQRLAVSERSQELESHLASSDPHDVELAAGLAQFGGSRAAQAQLASLLTHDSSAVRRKAMNTIASWAAPGCENEVVSFLRLEPDFDARQKALDYLEEQAPSLADQTERELLEHDDSMLQAMAAARLLSRPSPPADVEAKFEAVITALTAGGPSDQAAAAQLLGLAPLRPSRSAALGRLLNSDDPEVVRAAVRSIGELSQDEDLPRLIRLLGQQALSSEVRRAVAAYGNRAIPSLSAVLRDDGASPRLQKQAARALGRIDGRQAAQALLAYLRRSREVARPDALRALQRIRERDPQLRFDPEIVNLLVRSALRRLYRDAVYSISAEAENGGPAAQFLAQALREKRDRRLDEVFALLALVLPQKEIGDSLYRLKSGDRELRANALEFLDSRLMGSPLRPILLPAVEEDSSEAILDAAARLFDIGRTSYANVLLQLLDDPDPWLQACACYAAAEARQRSCRPRIDQLSRHPDPLLRETAAAASARL